MSGARDQLSLLSPSVAPILKWVGSKSWLVPSLVPEILGLLRRSPSARYHELFLGSGAVFFALRQAGWAGRASLSDACGPLIGMYRALNCDPHGTIGALCGLLELERTTPREALYYEIRETFNREHGDSNPLQAARLIWLNHRCFNGLYRTNDSGAFNTSYGGDERTGMPTTGELAAVSDALQNATTTHASFDAETTGSGLTIPRIYHPGDVVFADPPYDGTFTSYTGTFAGDEQMRLAGMLHGLAASGVHVFATNSDTPQIRRLYHWASAEVLTTSYRVGGDREPVSELLLRGGGA